MSHTLSNVLRVVSNSIYYHYCRFCAVLFVFRDELASVASRPGSLLEYWTGFVQIDCQCALYCSCTDWLCCHPSVRDSRTRSSTQNKHLISVPHRVRPLCLSHWTDQKVLFKIPCYLRILLSDCCFLLSGRYLHLGSLCSTLL